ncbi:MAG: triple tyrosine motif-containing protein [Saprospiraceae bacterium]
MKASLILVLFPAFTQARNPNIGYPFIENYPTATYQAGVQNWSIQQHQNAYLLFANNNGLLQYDGSSWTCFPLKNKTIARSLLVKEDKIYIGGQNEFGFFQPDETGLLTYHSLLELIPEKDRNFEDVWKIVEQADGNLLFFASNKLFQLKGNEISVVSAKYKINFLGKANDRIFVQTEEGIAEFKKNTFFPFRKVSKLKDFIITSTIPLDDQKVLFTTLKNGIFTLDQDEIKPWNTPFNDFLKSNRIYCATVNMEGHLILGTTLAGVLILDKTGELIVHLSKKTGLQKNNILSVFIDKSNNLWLGLDNGIDYAQTNGPYAQVIPDGDLEGTAYASIIYKDFVYFGTSSGLYYVKKDAAPRLFNDSPFQLVEGTQGQVWGLQVIADQLLLGHHEGAFVIEQIGEKQTIKRLSNAFGVWKFLPLQQHPGFMLAGTYEGLELYQKKDGLWTFVRKFEALMESCRFLEEDEQGDIWVAHPYRGIYKVKLNPEMNDLSVRLYGEQDGLSSNNLNNVFHINKEILFTSETGIFTYNATTDRFEPHYEMQDLLKEEPRILRLFEDTKGNILFVGSNNTGLLILEDKGISKSFEKRFFPELTQQLVRGFEFIYPFDDHHIVVGAEKGFIQFDPFPKMHGDHSIAVSIRSINSISERDSAVLSGQYGSATLEAQTPFHHRQDAFRFTFTAPYYQIYKGIVYQCFLEGFDNAWSSWSNKGEKEYTNLKAGNYTFKVKAKNRQGQISPIASYSFTIKPPWYYARIAKIIYALLLFSFLSGLILVPRSRFKRKTADLVSEQLKKEAAHQKTVAQTEQQIIALKNKNLQAEINYKNKELASITMHWVQRSEMINQLKSQLEKLGKSANEPNIVKEINRLIRLLSKDEDLDKDWDQFAHHFDQVHSNFLKSLKTRFPQLTSNDQKLCAYLRMNLSTKEIAPLMNISIRGVEVGRYRLRKKLNLDSGVDLNQFMMEI